MIALLVWIVIVLLVAGFLAWLVSALPFIVQPYQRIIQGVIAFFVLIWLIWTLYSFFAGVDIATPGPYGAHHRGLP